MAKIEKVVVEIMTRCNELGYNVNYQKIQKLAYICQCVHFARYDVPLAPEKLFYWSDGGGFREISELFFEIKCLDVFLTDIELGIENEVINQLDELAGKFLLRLEKQTINFVLAKYGNKECKELIQLTLKDPLFKKITIGDQIFLNSLDDLFVTENELKTIGSGCMGNFVKTKRLKRL